MPRFKSLAPLIVAGVLLAILAAFVFRQRLGRTASPDRMVSPPAQGRTEAKAAPTPVGSRSASRRPTRSEIRVAPSQSAQDKRIEEALNSAVNIKREMLDGQEKWLTTVLAVEDLFLARDARRRCGRDIGFEIEESCHYSLDLAIERTGRLEGTIVAARSELSGDATEDVCEAYASCIATTRLGEKVALPEGADGIHGISQKLIAIPDDPGFKDLKRLQQMIDDVALDLEKHRAQLDPSKLDDRYSLKTNEMLLRFMRAIYDERAQELQAATTGQRE